MTNPLWDKLPPFIRDYRLTASFLTFLTLLAVLQALFNFHESPTQVNVHITSSHEKKEPGLTSQGLLNGSTIWHAPAEFPQWVQFDFAEPTAITRLEMMSQESGPNDGQEFTRSPKTFSLSAANKGGDWKELLHVDDARFQSGGQWLKWNVHSGGGYEKYRITITANNGDPNLLTIHRMSIKYD